MGLGRDMGAPVQGAGQGRRRRRALVAAPAGAQRTAIGREFRRAGYALSLVADAAGAAECLAAEPVAMVVCDWALGPDEAAGVIRAVRDRQGPQGCSFVLAIIPLETPDEASAALAAGADDILCTPIVPLALRCRLAASERLSNMADRLIASTRGIEEMLARLQARNRATEADLAEARRLQQGLIGPRQRRFGSMDISLLFHPAGHVGGDLVGFFPINLNRVALYAIDVCGNGVAAALLTARLAAHLATVVGENIALRLDENDLYSARPPAEVARMFNLLMLEDVGSDVFFTMVYADLDTVSGAGRLVQAGHPHPLMQSSDGSITRLGEGGLPVGLIEGADWEEIAFTLEPGSRLLIGSDGITEASAPDGTLLGDEGLEAILRTNRLVSGTPFLESLCWSVGQFTQGLHIDDISAILIEREAG